ncbi:hypothetical protein [Haloplanus aerogenes]|uniref:Uncharacterized protein n=1 Tax=Haloplanus aerogenes TaxID=660522 RepID=A0A3G8QSR2_9EURY|nr:hypothetical protein [Haloplanus aerogenes]AZH24557.1 hypothetical protein DU502_03790 [Haloplanus aerogenes]
MSAEPSTGTESSADDDVTFAAGDAWAGVVACLPVALGVAGASHRLPEERRSSLSPVTASCSGCSPVASG